VQPLRLLSWNLFHGRDHPPEPDLFTWRSRLFRVTERGEKYAQVNRPLQREFTEVLDRVEWDVALLQEAPPRWSWQLDAQVVRVLTSRNWLGPLRALAARLNPDLIASNEGGSNQLLVRPPWRAGDVETHVLATRPERRTMLMTKVDAPGGGRVAVANVHASLPKVPGAGEQVLAAAARAVEFAGDLPLVFGGDLNARVTRQPHVFEQLEERFGLAPPTARDAIDHLLVRGLEIVEPPRRLPPEAREVTTGDGLLLQLSDHACVVAVAGMK
jgi:endonuclease/exonuclease/phosphatase family metal-dependent hydrolase